MRTRRPLFAVLIAAGLALLSLGPSAVRSQSPPPSTPEGEAGREILVMLKLTPDHFRPVSSYGGDYGDQLTASGRKRAAQAIARRHNLQLQPNGWPMPLLGLDCYVMRVPSGVSVEDAVAQVSRDPGVAWSEPMHLYRAEGAPQGPDPLYRAQPAARAWRLADLHRLATGKGVTVAVIDSRVDTSHPDLTGQVIESKDFVGRPGGPERHGTGVAGVIAARADNGLGIMGVAPGARLLALRACWQQNAAKASSPTYCDSLSLAKALHYAIDRRAGIINLSLGGPPDPLLKQLIDVATGRNITVIAAYDPAAVKGGFPASEPGVIAVASQGLPSTPANVYGAPGKDIPTTVPGGTWSLVNGSSYAAAHVSGLAALVREGRRSSVRAALVAAHAAGGTLDACATMVRLSGCRCDCGAGRQVARAGR